MHPAAYDWVTAYATDEAVEVLDIGGRNINGSVKDLFPGATRYTAVDLYLGEGVDVVADVTQWQTNDTFDVVVCAEVLEHAEGWRDIVAKAFELLRDGGRFIMTCAGPGRHPHSGVDGEWRLHPGEHYGNVSPGDLEETLRATGWSEYVIDVQGLDLRCLAIR